jgi:hypothetical protein
MADMGAVTRHTCPSPRGPFVFYAPESATPAEHVMRRRLSVLGFSCCQPTQKPLLPAERFQEVLGAVALKGNRAVPPWQPCYLHRSSTREQQRLSLIWATDTPDLQAAITSMDDLVASPGFRAWLPFASINSFVLTFLLPASQSEANELSRWIRRRQPVCRQGPRPQPIDVFVYGVPHYVAA